MVWDNVFWGMTTAGHNLLETDIFTEQKGFISISNHEPASSLGKLR